MRRASLVALAACLVASAAPVVRGDEAKLTLVRVPVESASEAQLLLNGFDETHNHGSGWVELLLWPGDEAALESLGFSYEVVEGDLVARDAARRREAPRKTVSLPGPDRDDYRRLSDYEEEMQQLAKRHSFIRLLTLKEESLEGRATYGLEIAPSGNRGRPTFYVDGLHHAREWPSGEHPMIFAHYLAERFGKDPGVTRLLRRVKVVIVPVVNPDGFDYSRESLADAQGLAGTGLAILGAEAYWRKNRRSFTGVTVPVAQRNPDAYGVDPNRNYALFWGADESGSSGMPVLQTYRGDAPFSEPETRNIRRLLLRRNATVVITNHTYGRLVLRAWGHTSEDAPDESVLRSLGARMARAMGGYANMKGIGLYATHGTTDDWAYGAIGSLGYTFELGDAFHPPYSNSVGADWRGVVEAFMLGARAAANPRLHGIVRGRVLKPDGTPARGATITLTKSFETPLGDGNPTGEAAVDERVSLTLETDRRGYFRWHLNPSTRPLPEAGGEESYRLSFAHGANATRVMRVVVDRGRVRDLGAIRLTAGSR